MWAVQEPQRFTRALKGSHQITSRLELWSQGKQVAEAPFIDGEVTDTWVAVGIRRSLDMTVPPTRSWLKYLDLPLLEARPYRGIRFSRAMTAECPLGRFPIVMPDMTRPIGPIKISADDYYQRIMQADFSFAVQTETKPAVYAIRDLFQNAGGPFAGAREVVVTTANRARTNGVLLDKSRNDAIVGYAKSFGLEVFFDRVGVPTIQDAQVLGAPSTSVLADETAESVAVKADWSKVYNQVSVTSSAQDTDFPAQVAAITDPKHPAAQWKIGARVLKYSSPYLLDQESAMAAARTILTKVSASAQTYSYDCVPDPRRAAGDSILGSTMTGSQTFQIQSVSMPLLADGRQQITTVSTQQRYDNVVPVPPEADTLPEDQDPE